MHKFLRLNSLFLCVLLLPAIAWAQRQRVSAGYGHTVVIKADGTLWAWGTNAFGEVGDGTTTLRPTPRCISSATDWVSVSAGNSHTLALRRDGTLWAWGFGGGGRLGVIRNTYFAFLNVPTQVGTDTTWVCASAGGGHSLAVRRDGTLWAWGPNFSGELGNGSTGVGINQPTQVGTATDWSQVAAGSGFGLATRRNGTLWAWGENGQGQLGLGNGIFFVPTQVGTATDWVSISAGDFHSLGVRGNGSLWGWGSNDYKQLLQAGPYTIYTPQALSPAMSWVSAEAGSFHSLALRADGSLWTWGLDDVGELGVGRQTAAPVQQVTPGTSWLGASAASGHTIAIRPDGTVWSWGYNPSGEIGTTDLTLKTVAQPLRVGAATTWASIAAGQRHTAALRADSTLWLWGANDRGQLGEPLTSTNYYRYTPAQLPGRAKWIHVSCGEGCTFAVRADGTLWVWGANGRSQLGLGAQAASASSFFQPQQVGTATNWASVAVGNLHTLGLRTDGTLWAWGNNDYGQIGSGGPAIDVVTPQRVGTATTWSRIAACQSTSLALRTDGTIWSWGSNGVGQLGSGTTFSRALPAQVGAGTTWANVVAGNGHVLATRQDGTLWGWGYNLGGQLGDGTTTNRLSPVQVGTATNWTKIAAGISHSVALRANGTAWQWGAYTYYLDQYNLPALITQPTLVPGAGAGWATLAAGHAHSAMVRADGSLWAWGFNGASQLGNQIFTDVPVLIPLLGSPLAAPAGQAVPAGLAVYPNPAHRTATIVGADATAPVMLFDLLGREVKRLRSHQPLSVEGLPTGVYFVRQGHQTVRLLVE